jgi:hypothetical protein
VKLADYVAAGEIDFVKMKTGTETHLRAKTPLAPGLPSPRSFVFCDAIGIKFLATRKAFNKHACQACMERFVRFRDEDKGVRAFVAPRRSEPWVVPPLFVMSRFLALPPAVEWGMGHTLMIDDAPTQTIIGICERDGDRIAIFFGKGSGEMSVFSQNTMRAPEEEDAVAIVADFLEDKPKMQWQRVGKKERDKVYMQSEISIALEELVASGEVSRTYDKTADAYMYKYVKPENRGGASRGRKIRTKRPC